MEISEFRSALCTALTLLFCFLTRQALAGTPNNIIIESLVRHVDLKSHVAAITQAVVLRHRGSETAEYTYALIAKTPGCPYPGRVTVHTEKQDLLLEKVASPELHLPKLSVDIDSKGINFYKVPLTLKGGETLKYNLRYICGRSLRPFPKKRAFNVGFIAQRVLRMIRGIYNMPPPGFTLIVAKSSDAHTVIYADYDKTPAVYPIASQHIRIYLPSRNPIELVNVTRTQKPGVYETSTVRHSAAYDFGFYPAVKIRYVYNHHLGVFHNVKRLMDVSLRGSINIHEAFEFENGTRLSMSKNVGSLLPVMKSCTESVYALALPWPELRKRTAGYHKHMIAEAIYYLCLPPRFEGTGMIRMLVNCNITEAAELSGEYSRTAVTRFIKGSLGRRTAHGYPPHRTCFQMEAVLPSNAFAIEFFDAIGNVSTSNARRREKDILLQLEPRYPVLGGWKSDWFLEYKIPTESAVTVSPTASTSDVLYHVQLPIGHAIRETFTQSLTCEIVLPQEARNIQLTAPYPLKDLRISASHWGWLDIFQARPVLSFTIEGFAPTEGFNTITDKIKITYQSYKGWWQFRKLFSCQIVAFAPLAVYMMAKRFRLQTFSSKATKILASSSPTGVERVGFLMKNLELVAQSSYEQLLTASTVTDVSNISQTWKDCRDSLMLDISQAVAMERDVPGISLKLRSIIRLADTLSLQLLTTMDDAIATINIKKHNLPSTVEKKWKHVRQQCREFQKGLLSLPSQLPSNIESPASRR